MPKLPGRGGEQEALPALDVTTTQDAYQVLQPSGLQQFVGGFQRAPQEFRDHHAQYAPTRKPPKTCTECKLVPKKRGHPLWCPDCWLRHQPMDVQIQQARLRLGSVRIEDHKSRREAHLAIPEGGREPEGRDWCTGCQSWRPKLDFKDSSHQCIPCVRDKAHRAHADRTYEGGSDLYDQLFKLQDGKCAICRNRPIKKRLAEDHDHKTNVVRGLLCDRCNHDLLGAAHDSVEILKRAVWYLTNPPASGSWDVDVPPF